MKKIFASRIKELRINKEVFQKDLAKKINVTERMIREYESEKSLIMPSAEKLKNLADFFNVSIDYLLGRTNNPNINL